MGWSSVRHLPPLRRADEELAARLCDPDLFGNGVQAARDLTFTSETHFHFTSPIATPWPVNNLVSGRLFRCGANWRERPAVILVHGWNGEAHYLWQFPYWARRLSAVGVNTAMLELPYHGHRRPRGEGVIDNFISGDLLLVLEATRQSMADLRALIGWLQAQGCPRVGIWGV